jgi:hypothetical protein
MQYACVVLYCHLWPLRLCHIFFILCHKRHFFRVGGLGRLLNIKYVFWFSLQLCTETVIILSITEQDILKNAPYIGLHVKYLLFLSDFIKVGIPLLIFGKMPRYQISWNPVQWERSFSRWTDGLTDTKLRVAFGIFALPPENYSTVR